jgi:aspartate/methionine/tyrosine aminotransferase
VDRNNLPGFRSVPLTGVIYVMREAASRGYHAHHPAWANLGQGAPETGALPDAPPRIHSISLTDDEHEYAPVDGTADLRDAVAALYNARYRQGKASQYTRDNVCVASGGRVALTRLVSTLGRINIGHFLPDYTAYEELLDIFKRFTAIPILLDPARGYEFGVDELRREITGRGLSALLLSNPGNPHGRVVQGAELAAWVATARELQCSLLIDEFYSQYVWTGDGGAVSAARYVEDVDTDPVVLFDGFTKNWRYPGWRCTWIVGPRAVIEAVSSSGSFLDGGGSRPLQRRAVPLLAPDYVRQESAALRRAFRRKRELLIDGLRAAGLRLGREPEGTFYCWADVSGLPEGLDDGMAFFRRALDKRVICVPGEFFDINPGKRRSGRASRFRRYVRFSFGPEEAQVAEGVRRIGELVAGR